MSALLEEQLKQKNNDLVIVEAPANIILNESYKNSVEKVQEV